MIKMAVTENGLVRGTGAADPRVISYKGIPFAAPPTGELRWCAPRPAENWDGIKDCLEFAPISMQSIPGVDKENIYTREWNPDPEIPMDEDCLYLNVWTPAESTAERLPVYVWFFGGALQFGNTAEMEFDGERLARRGIVVVTVNYRLNVFGFLAHPELSKEAPEAPTNFGHLDQQYGLHWVKRNIGAFGGDPDNITIGGQSAGGSSVMTQLNCPANQDYIQRAVVFSGMFLNPFEDHGMLQLQLPLGEVEKKGEQFFAFLGVHTLAEARALPAAYIRDKNDAFQHYWGTVVDGVYQTDSYWNNILSGKFPDVPMLTGLTNNEFFLPPQSDAKKDLKGVSMIELAIRVFGEQQEKWGKKSPRYVYEFGAKIPGWDDPGAFHSSDLWFFFETLAKCWRPFTGTHYDLARQMCNYLTEFVKKGDPNGRDANGKEMEQWVPFTCGEPKIMTFYQQPVMKVLPAEPAMDFCIKKIEKKNDMRNGEQG